MTRWSVTRWSSSGFGDFDAKAEKILVGDSSVALVQGFDAGQLVMGELEVKDVEVLRNSVPVHRFDADPDCAVGEKLL